MKDGWKSLLLLSLRDRLCIPSLWTWTPWLLDQQDRTSPSFTDQQLPLPLLECWLWGKLAVLYSVWLHWDCHAIEKPKPQGEPWRRRYRIKKGKGQGSLRTEQTSEGVAWKWLLLPHLPQLTPHGLGMICPPEPFLNSYQQNQEQNQLGIYSQ